MKLRYRELGVVGDMQGVGAEWQYAQNGSARLIFHGRTATEYLVVEMENAGEVALVKRSLGIDVVPDAPKVAKDSVEKPPSPPKKPSSSGKK